MKNEKLLGAYYFRGGMFTLVPRHVREQLDDMREIGTDVVCLAVNLQDCGYNRPNLEFLVSEIHQRGMKVYFVPSRTAGITAGAPLTADTLGYRHPHTWAQNRDGTPVVRDVGVLCSFYHEEVEEHFRDVVRTMMERFAPDGIIWDEPKSTNWQDFSPKALENNPDGDWKSYLADYTDFFTRVNGRIKEAYPDLKIVNFDEACRWNEVVEATARIGNVDYIGVDGRPCCPDENGEAENRGAQKVLPFYGERYLRAARENDKGTFALIENQRLTTEASGMFERDIDTVLGLDVDFLVYYYYGFHQPEAERNMELIRCRLPAWRKR